MAILVNKKTKVITQGITGKAGVSTQNNALNMAAILLEE